MILSNQKIVYCNMGNIIEGAKYNQEWKGAWIGIFNPNLQNI